MREKYWWLVADKPNEQAANLDYSRKLHRRRWKGSN
jgi:hypothetical protein